MHRSTCGRNRCEEDSAYASLYVGTSGTTRNDHRQCKQTCCITMRTARSNSTMGFKGQEATVRIQQQKVINSTQIQQGIRDTAAVRIHGNTTCIYSNSLYTVQ